MVIDDVEHDPTARVAASAGAKVVANPKGGLGAARQRGAEVASQAYVAYVDSDAVIQADTLSCLLEEAASRQLDAVDATLRTLERAPSYWQRGEEWRRNHLPPPTAGEPLECIVTLVRRSLVLSVGFDDSFSGAAEDRDFFFRATEAGAAIGRSARAVAHHEDRRTLRAFASQRIWHGRGLARLVVRHPRRYRQSLAARALEVRPGIAWRYVPFMAVSTGCLVAGMALESARIVVSPRLRRKLHPRPNRPRG